MTASVAATDTGGRTPGSKPGFARDHRWDRDFFLAAMLLTWVGIGVGFGTDIVNHIRTHAPPYLPIVHAHAAAFMAWPVVFTVQILLIRRRAWDLHRKLGAAALVLAAVMVVLGPATAIAVASDRFAATHKAPISLSFQLTDMLAFAGLVAAAGVAAARGWFSAHKRLLLLATFYIADAGFARLLGDPLEALFGMGFWSLMAQAYLASDLLMAGLGAYDLVTRRRLHPAYVGGLVWVLAIQMPAAWLYVSPLWPPFALRLIGQ